VDKTIRILLSFGDGRRHGVRDISRELGLPRSTVSRLILDLAEAGLVTQDEESGHYRLGAGAARLGQAYLEGLDVRAISAPIMARLQEQTAETVGLHVREGLTRIVVASAESKATVRSGFSIGERLPLHAGAGGKVLLAFEAPAIRQELLSGLTLTPLTDRTILDLETLTRELDGIRRRGYATSANEVSMQSASLAAPIFAGDDRLAAAIVVTGPVFRVTKAVLKTVVPLAMDAASDISARLGSRRTDPRAEQQ
jgi:DNA-binding IclR family transcriptional regulator